MGTAGWGSAVARDGRLLRVEVVVPAGDTPHPDKMLDVVMLAFTGGHERTEAEYGATASSR